VTRRFLSALAALAAVCALAACVLTTHEGPSEPPRITAPPPLPGSPSPGPEPRRTSSLDVGDAQPVDGGASAEPAEIAASHILIMYRGSMRAPAEITRSKDEALARAQEVLKRAAAGEDFGVLVNEYSDDRGSKTTGGKLGRFQRRMMVKPFADAAFALKVGELSAIVESQYGYHVILRTE
jgi:peptidyl-prolyl cis-trans isomerase NIMA-interacting 1